MLKTKNEDQNWRLRCLQLSRNSKISATRPKKATERGSQGRPSRKKTPSPKQNQTGPKNQTKEDPPTPPQTQKGTKMNKTKTVIKKKTRQQPNDQTRTMHLPSTTGSITSRAWLSHRSFANMFICSARNLSALLPWRWLYIQKNKQNAS